MIQDALANFIDILPELPLELLKGYGTTLLRLLADKLKLVGSTIIDELDDEFENLSVCNNACWTIGEVAKRLPEQAKPMLEEIVNIFG